MADLEERPSKIRKLNATTEANVTPQKVSELSDTPMEELPQYDDEQAQDGKDAQTTAEENGTEEQPKLSKSQLKKLRRAEEWEAGRDYRRAKRREKHKAKQARKAEDRAEYAAKLLSGEIKPPPPPVVENKRPRRPIQVPVSLILDCDFNELMTDKEIISLGAQLTRGYSENRSTPYRSHFAISSWGGVLKERFETKLASHYLSWKGVRFIEGDFEEAAKELNAVMRGPEGGKLAGALAKKGDEAKVEDIGKTQAEEPKDGETREGEVSDLSTEAVPAAKLAEEPVDQALLDSLQDVSTQPDSASTAKDQIQTTSETPSSDLPPPKIVYLTSDSEHTLTSLEPNTSYIIGGIVDKNRHKGICYKRACERGIPTAKLPIGEFMIMQSRSVLAVNHVVEIMLKWLDTGDWGEAFMAVIPKRKEAKLRVKKVDGQGEEQDQDHGEEEHSGENEESDNDNVEGEDNVKSSVGEERSEEKDVGQTVV